MNKIERAALLTSMIGMIVVCLALVVHASWTRKIREEVHVLNEDVQALKKEDSAIWKSLTLESEAQDPPYSQAMTEEEASVFYIRDVHNIILWDKVRLYSFLANTTYVSEGQEWYQYVVDVGTSGFVIGDRWLNIDVQPHDVVYPLISDGPPFLFEYKICNREGCGPRIQTGFEIDELPMPPAPTAQQ